MRYLETIPARRKNMSMTPLETDQAEAIVEWLLDEGFEATVYSNYSGRGMYGSTCPGIVAEAGLGPMIGYAAAKCDVPPECIPSRTDNLGLDFIYY
jgi:hypothetical protein